MPNSNYIKGRSFEYQVKKDFEADGYLVMRASGSHGIFDLACFCQAGSTYLIQCKVTNDKKTINNLKKEFCKVKPFDQSVYTQALAIKVTGTKEYTLYIPE